MPTSLEILNQICEGDEESAKQFIARNVNAPLEHPDTFPEFKRWRKHVNPGGRRAVAYTKNVPSIRSTSLWKLPGERAFTVKYHSTDVLRFENGKVLTNTSGWKTRSSFDRMNRYLPWGWEIIRYKYNWYWRNHHWPPDLFNGMRDIMSRRAWPDPARGFILYHDYDWIDRSHTLHSDHDRVTATQHGEIQRTNEPANESLSLAEDLLEGSYMDKLDWIARLRKKHAKMKEIKRMQKDVEEVDKPDKKRKKRLNIH